MQDRWQSINNELSLNPFQQKLQWKDIRDWKIKNHILKFCKLRLSFRQSPRGQTKKPRNSKAAEQKVVKTWARLCCDCTSRSEPHTKWEEREAFLWASEAAARLTWPGNETAQRAISTDAARDQGSEKRGLSTKRKAEGSKNHEFVPLQPQETETQKRKRPTQISG